MNHKLDSLGRPTFGAVMLLLLVIMFFGAATNTLSGWLYALSGLGLAFLVLGSLGPVWALRGLTATRLVCSPCGYQEVVTVSLTISGRGGLLQVQDNLPQGLGRAPVLAIETLPGTFTYTLTPQQRGIYRWSSVRVRSGAPLGLVWRGRDLSCPGQLVVYPRVWRLSRCDLVAMAGTQGERQGAQQWSRNQAEGATRSVRPYRMGDPMRWVHWRTSARLGELQVRELEQPQSNVGLSLVLDLTPPWDLGHFESALEAVVSLFVYAHSQGIAVQLVTPVGWLTESAAVLTYLAGVTPGPMTLPEISGSLLWFSPRPGQGVWVGVDQPDAPVNLAADQPLGPQLERAILRREPSLGP
ncbi:DUF58 domain-containing protein [Candidatus Cyanaurora vandensis]|uniref:DUF58 domain-containing protein n=1 Tax=Candidatus Cyanaurora vandensis TaxID=2714958 RepID=UPI00257B5A75|nr:DUF58 domain-containing protein [Candidatus Cyanaurora vandensis]